MPKYHVVPYEGYKFVFKFDEMAPELLHIWVRHLTTPEIAIKVWIEGTEEEFNSSNRRFETYSEDHGLYWFWLSEPDGKIFVISCFKRY